MHGCATQGPEHEHDDDDSDPLIGALLDGRFRVVRRIAKGGMGTVYEGVQLSIDRPVAIKMIRGDLVHDTATAKRFLREARVLTRFNHPHVVKLLDAGQTASGALYLVMELLRGETLLDELARVGTFSVERACEVALEICEVLVSAELWGIVHRDLKPANIVIDDALGLVKVLDFGLAKSLAPEGESSAITRVGVLLGTPQYMAPEAIGGEIDPRGDLYALGCILYELLAGGPPFDAPDLPTILRAQLEQPAPPLPEHVPAALRVLVGELLEKQPIARPASACEVRERLAAVLEAEREPATLVRAPPVVAARAAASPHHASLRVVGVLLAITAITFVLVTMLLTR
jgi:serine/threonine-protein kinase